MLTILTFFEKSTSGSNGNEYDSSLIFGFVIRETGDFFRLKPEFVAMLKSEYAFIRIKKMVRTRNVNINFLFTNFIISYLFSISAQGEIERIITITLLLQLDIYCLQ